MITIKSPAKINLFLDVLGRRRDGYHDIRSLLMPISLFDTVRIESRPAQLSFFMPAQCRFSGIPWVFSMGAKKDNLVTRAAELFKQMTGCKKGAAIFLTKRIPIGAGLGGGSADAAAVITGLNRLWNTRLSVRELMEAGARIGSDVPSLIHGGPICLEGRGEVITPVNRLVKRNFFILLVYPGFAISTADIYKRHDCCRNDILPAGFSRSKFQMTMSGLQLGSTYLVGRGLFNVLQKTVFAKYPLLEMIKKCLEKAGTKHVLLTGSGSTVFVLLKRENEGNKIGRLIRSQIRSPLWTKIVHTIGKQEAQYRF